MAENTKNSCIETRSSAVILFVLTVCYRKKTAALLSIAGSSGTLDRLPSMFRLTRLRLFLLEHAAGLSISSRNIGNDNNTACPYCSAGPAVFARVRLETNQSADCPDHGRAGKDSKVLQLLHLPLLLFLLALFFLLLLLFLLSVLPVYFFLFLLFLFFNHFIFYSFSLIFFLLPILYTMTTILSVVNKICRSHCFPLNHQHYRHFYNTDWSPTADRHFVRISVRISQTICRCNSALRHIKSSVILQRNNGALKRPFSFILFHTDRLFMDWLYQQQQRNRI